MAEIFLQQNYQNQQLMMELPIGYRFSPSDEELVRYYLIPKIAKRPLPINLIYEVELKNYNPQTLAEKYKPQGENIWYFFTQRDRKYRNGERPNRRAGDGYWRLSGSEIPVKDDNEILIGSKKSLVFRRGKHPKGKKTNWIMYEYTIYKSSRQPSQRASPDDMRLHEWVLCTIHKYQRSSRTNTDGSNDDEENSIIAQPLNQNNMNSNSYNFHVEHINGIQNGYTMSYPSQVQTIMDPYNYNPHWEQSNGIQVNHTTLSLSPEQNIMNLSVKEDISVKDHYELLFGPPKQNATNLNIDQSIPIQNHCTTSSQPVNQNVTNPNTFDNPDFLGGYGDFPVGQVRPNGQFNPSHPHNNMTPFHELEYNIMNPNNNHHVQQGNVVQDCPTMTSQPPKQTVMNPNMKEDNSDFVEGYSDFNIDHVHPHEQDNHMSYLKEPTIDPLDMILSSLYD